MDIPFRISAQFFYKCLSYTIHATFPTHLILLDLIITDSKAPNYTIICDLLTLPTCRVLAFYLDPVLKHHELVFFPYVQDKDRITYIYHF
jgi:hypothetical protein